MGDENFAPGKFVMHEGFVGQITSWGYRGSVLHCYVEFPPQVDHANDWYSVEDLELAEHEPIFPTQKPPQQSVPEELKRGDPVWGTLLTDPSAKPIAFEYLGATEVNGETYIEVRRIGRQERYTYNAEVFTVTPLLDNSPLSAQDIVWAQEQIEQTEVADRHAHLVALRNMLDSALTTAYELGLPWLVEQLGDSMLYTWAHMTAQGRSVNEIDRLLRLRRGLCDLMLETLLEEDDLDTLAVYLLDHGYDVAKEDG